MVSLSHAVVEIYRLNNVNDWQSMMPDILSKLGIASGADRVLLFQASLDQEAILTASEIFSWSASGRKPSLYHIALRNIGLSDLLDTMNRNESYTGTGRDLTLDRKRVFFPPQLKYTFIVPVFVSNRLWGFVRFDNDTNNELWNIKQQNVIRAAVSQIASSVERIERHISRPEYEHRLTRLYRIMGQDELQPAERIQALQQIGLEELQLDIAIISHITGKDYRVDYVQPDNTGMSPGQVFDRGMTYCDVTLNLGKTVAIAHAASSEFNRHPCHLEFKLEAYIGSALTVDGQLYGTVNFSSSKPHAAFSAGDRAFVNEISRLVGQILEG